MTNWILKMTTKQWLYYDVVAAVTMGTLGNVARLTEFVATSIVSFMACGFFLACILHDWTKLRSENKLNGGESNGTTAR